MVVGRFNPGKEQVPMVQEAGWAPPGPIWTIAEDLAPIGIRSPDLPARSELLFRLRYPLSLPIPKRSQIARQLGLRFCELGLVF